MMSDDKKIIELFDQADFFIFAHESGHVFFEDIRMLLRKIKKEGKDSLRAIRDRLGVGPLFMIKYTRYVERCQGRAGGSVFLR